MVRINLPWPSRVLHPNSRPHWAAKAKAAKAARQIGTYCTLETGIHRGDPDIPEKIKATLVFYPPDNRRRDVDGMLSNVKSYLDGISDIIGIDDSRWQIALRRECAVKGGRVLVELEAA